jgi:Family of unknown function (DUF5343)
MAIRPNGPAPYAPPQTVISVIEAFRDRGLTSPFTTDVLLRAGVPETLTQRVLQTLRELELVDEIGNPTQQFEGLKQARGDEEYKARLQAWLQSAYEEILQFTNPNEDSPQRVGEAFRGFTPASQRARMVTLMLRLYEYAGMPTKIASSRAENGAQRRVHKGPQSAPKIREAQQLRSLRAPLPKPSTPDLPPGLLGLLQQIPTDGKAWSKDKRDNFLNAFTAVLDYTVPVGDGSSEVDEGQVSTP